MCRVEGAFVSTLIREAKQLESLELSHMPNMRWFHIMRSPTDVLPLLRSLELIEAGADGLEQGLFQHLPFLRKASLECSPTIVWAAARNWYIHPHLGLII